MKESIGNAMLFNLVIIFSLILIAFFVGSLSYTKAFKVKNKIIEEIEKEGEAAGREFTDIDQARGAYTKAEKQIYDWLRSGGENGQGIGYRMNTDHINECTYDKEGAEEVTGNGNEFEYCVYRIDTCKESNKDSCGVYYHVTTYMYFDLPIIDQLIKIPVNGETRTFKVRNN